MKEKRKRIGRGIARIVLVASGSIVGFFILLFLLVWLELLGPLPAKQDIRELEQPIASEVYSADSVLLGRYFFQQRSPVRSAEIPKHFKELLIATEDVRFYKHSGIDFRSLGRVLLKTLLFQDESSGGGSTITQQLAKNTFPRKDYAVLSLPINKFREFIIARRIESVYSKDEILVRYLNTVPFADNTYGVKTAAERFFSTDVSKLSVTQSATLVGMLKATHRYNPRLFPERSKERRNVVLAQGEKYSFITELEKNKLMKEPLALRIGSPLAQTGKASYFRAFIEPQLLEWCKENRRSDGSEYNLYRDGLRIYTTINSRLQEDAEQALSGHLKQLQPKFAAQLSRRTVDQVTSSVVRNLKSYQQLRSEGLSDAAALKRLKQSARTRVFTWQGIQERKMSVYDSVRHHVQFLQAGLLAMNPSNGHVMAYVGGINHQYFPFDHVRLSTRRQVGSTFKPIVYASAIEKGVDPCSYISARQESYANADDWTPRNVNEESYEKKYSLQGALASSVNTVSVKLLERAGIRNTIRLAHSLGVESELPAVPALALGVAEVSVTEMVTAYAALANQGQSSKPVYVTAITDRHGKILEQFRKPEMKQVISKETAQIMIHLMKGVVNSGTASALRSRYGLSNDIAGKTGTTQDNTDGWFVAAMPTLVVGVWVGADHPTLRFRSTAQGQGAATALPIVGKMLAQANRDRQLRGIMRATFAPMSTSLQERLNCTDSKSNKNFLERIFGGTKKKKPKMTKFKGYRKREEPS